MMITLPDWYRRARVAAAVVAVCAALSLRHGSGLESLKAAASQAVAAPSNSLEILEVRPSFFVITDLGHFRQQPKLEKLLSARFPGYCLVEGLIVYDMRGAPAPHP